MPITIENLEKYYDYDFEKQIIELHNYVEHEKTIKEFFKTLPKEIIDYASNFFSYMSKNWYSTTMQLPYNPGLMRHIRNWAANQKYGFHVREEEDKSYVYYEIKTKIQEKPKFEIWFSVRFNPNHADSTCILVPIETEPQPVKVKTYDRVCPDSHPELFKVDENGKLVYVGDNLFPPIKEVV